MDEKEMLIYQQKQIKENKGKIKILLNINVKREKDDNVQERKDKLIKN